MRHNAGHSNGQGMVPKDIFRQPDLKTLQTTQLNLVMLQSYLNMLRIVQMTADETSRIEFKIKVKAVDDPDVVQKVSILGKIQKDPISS